ncbi:hypothetical protein NL108_006131, partial [Boleophthalmus pectinirostris]
MKIILLLMLVCGTELSSVVQRYIWYNKYPLPWQDAQEYCQSASTELVTVVTQSDIRYTYMDPYYAWIALKLFDRWKWTDGTNFYNANGVFTQDEPDDNDDCGLANYTFNKAVGDRCEARHFFFCHYKDESNTRRYNFYAETKSWDDAFKYCQDNGQSLAIFNTWSNLPSDEKQNFPVWTGLYHDGESWRWSDGEYSDYWKWAAGFDPGSTPNSGLCGSVWSQNKTMSVHSCSEAFPFLCYSHNLVLIKQNLTWEEALEECKSLQTNNPSQSHQLLSVKPSDLLYANSKAIDAQTDKVWLGLRFLGGSWFWSNGQTV